MVPPRAPSFALVHGSTEPGVSAGKAGLRPRRVRHGSEVEGCVGRDGG
jgi:hypothetical protein